MSRLDELKQQLAQLDELIKSGVLTGESARQARDKLEADVLAAVLQPATAEVARTGAATSAGDLPAPSKRLMWGLLAFVVVFGATGYAWLGNREGLALAPGASLPAAPVATDAGSAPHTLGSSQIEAMAERLAERLKAKPDDAEGWAMLGRSYSVLGRNDQALVAYQRVIQLLPKDAQALADYADALGVKNGNKLDGEPEKLINQALALDPDNPKALFLAGTVALERGDAAGAVRHWERAMPKIEAGSNMARQLQGALDEARQRAGLPPSTPTATATATTAEPALATAPGGAATAGAASPGATISPPAAAVAPGAGVQVRISLAPALAAKASPDDTVFIFARALQGPKAPLAIQRRQVKDLPLELTLDDTMAMSPALRLSTVTQVVIGARISKSGNAMPQPSDLQGLSPTVAVGAKGVQLEIGETVR